MASSTTLSILIQGKDMASGAMRGVGGAAKSMGMSVQKAGMAMTAMGGATVAAMGLAVKSWAAAGNEVQKMAFRTGFAAEALSELKYATDISGASLESMEKGVKRMAKTITDASEGMATYIRAFERIGLNVKDLIGLSPEKQFEIISMAIADLENETIKAATAQDIFGRAGTQLLPMLALGADGIRELRQEAHTLGLVFDQEAAEAAARFTDSMTKLQGATNGLKYALAEGLVPKVEPLINTFTDLLEGTLSWTDANRGLTDSLIAMTGGIGGLMAVMGPLLLATRFIGGLPMLGIAGAGMVFGGAGYLFMQKKAYDAVLESQENLVAAQKGETAQYKEALIAHANLLESYLAISGARLSDTNEIRMWISDVRNMQAATESSTDAIEEQADALGIQAIAVENVATRMARLQNELNAAYQAQMQYNKAVLASTQTGGISPFALAQFGKQPLGVIQALTQPGRNLEWAYALSAATSPESFQRILGRIQERPEYYGVPPIFTYPPIDVTLEIDGEKLGEVMADRIGERVAERERVE